MSRAIKSVVGFDLGEFSFKAALLQRRSDGRVALANYASRVVAEDCESPEALAHHLKLLLKEIGGSPKGCAAAASSRGSFLRIIEQPQTPVELLRDALRLNGMALLNQDCRDFVVDCDLISPGTEGSENGGQSRYLVGGIPRARVATISEAFARNRKHPNIVQLAPVCLFNAFEFARPEIFANEAFILLDIGHHEATVVVGCKRELALVRSIAFGGKGISDAMTMNSSVDRDTAFLLLEKGDPGVTDAIKASLGNFGREVRSSIGFFEGQREETISRLYLSGGPAGTDLFVQILSDGLNLPCELWDPVDQCEIAVPKAKRAALETEFANLNIACGAALEVFRAR